MNNLSNQPNIHFNTYGTQGVVDQTAQGFYGNESINMQMQHQGQQIYLPIKQEDYDNFDHRQAAAVAPTNYAPANDNRITYNQPQVNGLEAGPSHGFGFDHGNACWSQNNNSVVKPCAVFPPPVNMLRFQTPSVNRPGFANGVGFNGQSHHIQNPLSYPAIMLHDSVTKILEWQLVALLAKNTTASLKKAEDPENDEKTAPTKKAKQVKGEAASISTSNSDLTAAVASTFSTDKHTVCKDLNNIFQYNLEKLQSNPDANQQSLRERILNQRFNRIPKRKFYDRGFEVRPASVHIPLYDGTYESEDLKKYRLENNIAQKTDQCHCLQSEVSEELEGPYYTHLAAAPSVAAIRRIFEERTGLCGNAIRIEKVVYTGKEGKTNDGCPVGKWIIRRTSLEEKLLLVVRERPGHRCATAVQCIVVVLYEGVPSAMSDDLYSYLSKTLTESGATTNRRCGLNEQRTCACQGMDDQTGGASFSFGCSWSMYYNTCKFSKSRNPKKFRLTDTEQESTVEEKLQVLTDLVSGAYAQVAPAAFSNQTYFSYKAEECRLGNSRCGPFSGVTACVDFCSHSHKDIYNMSNGSTVVVSLTKHRGLGKGDDEQLHVLPLYIPASTDEFGSEDQQNKKIERGAIEKLDKYPMNIRYRDKPLGNCKQRSKKALKEHTPAKISSKTIIKEERPHSADVHEMKPVLPSLHQPLPSFAQQFPAMTPYYQPMQPLPAYAPAPDLQAYGSYGYDPMHQYYNGAYYNPQWPYNPPVYTMQDPYVNVIQQQHYATNGYHPVPASPLKRNASEMSGETELELAQDPPNATPKGFYTVETNNDHVFADPQIGGVALSLPHGSILFEVAKREQHATTALKNPDRRNPQRISLVFYEHKNMNFGNHGFEEWERKLATKKMGLPDLVSARRAAASKIIVDLALPTEYQATVPLDDSDVVTAANLTEPSSSLHYAAPKTACKIVQSSRELKVSSFQVPTALTACNYLQPSSQPCFPQQTLPPSHNNSVEL